MVRTIVVLTVFRVLLVFNASTSHAQALSTKEYFRTISDIWTNVRLFDCSVTTDGYSRDLDSLLAGALFNLTNIRSQRVFCDWINQKILLPYGKGKTFAVYGPGEDSSRMEFLLPQQVSGHVWYWNARKQIITPTYPIVRLDSTFRAIGKDTLIVDLRCDAVTSYNANALLLSFFAKHEIEVSPTTTIVNEGWNEMGWFGYNYSRKRASTTRRPIHPIYRLSGYFGETAANLRPFQGVVIALTNASTQNRLGAILDALQSETFRIVHETKVPTAVLADQVKYFDSVFVEYNVKSFYSRRGGMGSQPDKEVEEVDEGTDVIQWIRKFDPLDHIRSYPSLTQIDRSQFKDSLNIGERLAGLAKVYGVLKFFYPFFAENRIDLGLRLEQLLSAVM